MKKEKLEKGKYYVATYTRNNNNDSYVYLFNKTNNQVPYSSTGKGDYYSTIDSSYFEGSEYHSNRLATEDEIEHHKQCITAGKHVKYVKPPVIELFPIY